MDKGISFSSLLGLDYFFSHFDVVSDYLGADC